MQLPTDSDAYQIVWLTRRLFRALAQKGGENLEGLDITVADRAVMEFLYPDKRLSVPEIAGRYQVSRQHVQVTVNALLENGLAVARDNPRHKRSPLIALTAKGRKLFGVVIGRDAAAIEALFSGIPAKDVRTTRRTLQALLIELKRGDQDA